MAGKLDVTNPTTVLRLGPKGVAMGVLGVAGLVLLWRAGNIVAGKATGLASQAFSGARKAASSSADAFFSGGA